MSQEDWFGHTIVDNIINYNALVDLFKPDNLGFNIFEKQ